MFDYCNSVLSTKSTAAPLLHNKHNTRKSAVRGTTRKHTRSRSIVVCTLSKSDHNAAKLPPKNDFGIFASLTLTFDLIKQENNECRIVYKD